MPILVTAPHGGYRKQLGDHELTRNPGSKARDRATAEITREMRAAAGDDLPILIDQLHRAYRTPQTLAHFESQVFSRLREIHERRDVDQPLLHLDVHGFRPTAATEPYDLILGTGHRTTMGGLDADHALAGYMSEQGYSVYLPTEKPIANERYAADGLGTLAQKVAHLALAQVGSVQIEINSAFRTSEGKKRGQRLARDLGEFCLDWARGIN